jgi:hypothetical protein
MSDAGRRNNVPVTVTVQELGNRGSSGAARVAASEGVVMGGTACEAS